MTLEWIIGQEFEVKKMTNNSNEERSAAIILAAVIGAIAVIVGPLIHWYLTTNASQPNDELLQATIVALQTQVVQSDTIPATNIQEIAGLELSTETPSSVGLLPNPTAAPNPTFPATAQPTSLPDPTQIVSPGPVIPTKPEEAAFKWGGQPNWWNQVESNGWVVQGQLSLTVEEGWRVDYTDPNGTIWSCGDRFEPGVYGPTTVNVTVATLWYVPGETQCPSWSTWFQSRP